MVKSPVKKYLIKKCKAHKEHVFEGDYCCLEEFVLKNGRSFETTIPLPSNIKKGKEGTCFENAFWVASGNRHKYYYCEGYAANKGMLPVLHAWVVNRKHEVIDPTCPFAKYYYGFIFKLSYVCQWVPKNRGHKSIIDNWIQGWPLLKETPKNLQKILVEIKS